MRPHSVFSAVLALTVLLSAVLSRPAAAVALHDFSSVRTEMRGLVDAYGLDGASLRVSRQGNVLYRGFFGGVDAETRVPIASASKWLSALAIARLIDRGRMHWNDTVGQYLPNAPLDKRGITLAQLFSHTSGMSPVEDLCVNNSAYTLATCGQRLLQLPMIGAPGRVFAYGNNSMQLAGRLAEIATGKTWDDIFLDEVVRPLGMTATDFAFASTAPGYVRSAHPRIASGVRSTLEDYGRVVDMLLADGCLDGGFPQHCAAHRRYLGSATLAEMARDRTAGTTVLFAPPSVPGYGYGFGTWLELPQRPGALPVLLSPGAFGFMPWVDRSANLAGVLLVRDDFSRLADALGLLRDRVRLATAEGSGRRIKLPARDGHRAESAQAVALPASSAPPPAASPHRLRRTVR